ncbi:MAG: hypothetical protein Tp1111DCM603221_39 [Prokaryotic dsDNA virus sp.]|nr:MAG: hypothetical protein Tp1111DCM603221_39 [Prokaryotic dsDNA virus sp.]|tara:strand:+ start:1758 stop:2234 length:477 start_codon:yes stop_codon:yes gene_type:complete
MSFGHLNHGKSPLEVPGVTGLHSDIVSFVCTDAIAAGEWVDLDSTPTLGAARATTVVQGNGTGLCIGVAVETITAAQITAAAADGVDLRIRVCVSGYVDAARTDGTVAAAGDTLIPAAGGECTRGAATNVLTAVGFALAVDTGGAGAEVAPVYVIRKY